jgi:hypothetical protein
MQRMTHPGAGHDAESRPEAAGGRQDPAVSAAPSYVESVLFRRRRRLSAEATPPGTPPGMPSRASEQERN